MVGVAGCKALYPDRQTIQHAGGKIISADTYTMHIGQGEKDRASTQTDTSLDSAGGGRRLARQRRLPGSGCGHCHG